MECTVVCTTLLPGILRVWLRLDGTDTNPGIACLMSHALVECMNRLVASVASRTLDASGLLNNLYVENIWDTKYVGGVSLERSGQPMVAYTFGERNYREMFSSLRPGAIVMDQTTNGLPLYCCYNSVSPVRRRATDEWAAQHQHTIRQKVKRLGMIPLRFVMHSAADVLMLDVRRDANVDVGHLEGNGHTILTSWMEHGGTACPWQCFTDLGWGDVMNRLALANVQLDVQVG
jgi:hypothetical protein